MNLRNGSKLTWLVGSSRNQLQYQIMLRSLTRGFAPVMSTTTLNIEGVRNPNLKFEAGDWQINLYPFYPSVYRKKNLSKVYEVAQNSNVLALTFLNKTVPEDVAWANRKSISLKFRDLCQMLSAELRSDKEVKIETDPTTNQAQQTRFRTLTLKDNSKKEQMLFSLKSEVMTYEGSPRTPEFEIIANMNYLEYRIVYKLLEASLLDLSGWKFMMEVQRRKEIGKVEGVVNNQNQFDDLLRE